MENLRPAPVTARPHIRFNAVELKKRSVFNGQNASLAALVQTAEQTRSNIGGYQGATRVSSMYVYERVHQCSPVVAAWPLLRPAPAAVPRVGHIPWESPGAEQLSAPARLPSAGPLSPSDNTCNNTATFLHLLPCPPSPPAPITPPARSNIYHENHSV